MLAQAKVDTPRPQSDEIDRQIAKNKQSLDPAHRQHAQMLLDCTNGDWLDQLVAEIEKEQQEPQVERKAA
jgi:cellobiose-specific phosphotransferase system component IIA